MGFEEKAKVGVVGSEGYEGKLRAEGPGVPKQYIRFLLFANLN